MTYLIAANVMTLSVLEGHSLLQAYSCPFFVFVACYVVPLCLQSFLLLTYFYLLYAD